MITKAIHIAAVVLAVVLVGRVQAQLPAFTGLSIDDANGEAVITWIAESTGCYTVMRTTQLASGFTNRVASALRAAGTSMVFTDTLVGVETAYYQVLAPDEELPMVISVSWSSPDTRYLNQHIDEFANLPFTGTEVTVSYPQNAAGSVLGGSTDQDCLSWHVFQSHPSHPPITDAMVADAIGDLQAIGLSGARDNFLKVVTFPRDSGWDWFDDTGWTKVLNNIGRMARVALEGNLKGISLDPEEYGVPMWSAGGTRPEYRLGDLPEYANRTWAETRAKVYERGISFGQAMTAEFPGVDVWTLYGYSHIVQQLPVVPVADLSDINNGLYAAFFDGMLRGTNEDSILIDGGEGAYRYIQRSEFAALRDVIENVAPSYSLEPALYSQKVRTGFGLYLDQYRYADSLPWDSENPQNNYMTPADLEYRLANAVAESDGYVWIYSEIPSWWLDSADDYFGDGVVSRNDHGWVDPAYRLAVKNGIRANTHVVSEDFDADPGWNQYGQPAFGIDIGFGASSNAGGSPGEAGGTFERFPEGPPMAGSYGISLGRIFTLGDPLFFSAKVFDSGDTEPYLGFYNEGNFVSSLPAYAPRAFLGYGPDINGDSFIKVYSPAGNSQIDPPTDPIGQFEIYVSYDPDAGSLIRVAGARATPVGKSPIRLAVSALTPWIYRRL